MLQCINQSEVRPRSDPALELHSRAASSVGVMYRSSGPNTGSNSGGGRIQKKNIYIIILILCLVLALSYKRLLWQNKDCFFVLPNLATFKTFFFTLKTFSKDEKWKSFKVKQNLQFFCCYQSLKLIVLSPTQLNIY